MSTRAESAILIGTPQSLSLLSDLLALLPDPPNPVAFVRVEPGAALSLHDPDEAMAPLSQLPALAAAHPGSLAIVSLPGAMRAEQQRVLAMARSHGLRERIIPPLGELLETPPAASGPAPEMDISALIGRTPHGIDRRAVSEVLENRRVLITGAGGSIGSEIARIAATFHPQRLILMERSENALFEIDRQIARLFPRVPRVALLHDIADAEATRRLIGEQRPDVIFHAAAHKHVPLMEDHPAHAVTNNLFGTKSVADAAVAAGCGRFVLISSDKAVNPTSVMGATKRLAEMYIQGLHRRRAAASGSTAFRPTAFSMVRFGNVLGSACSVLPIWSAQLREGGPITVTDPRMTRYFMTIHEAAMLVIQSAAIAPEPEAGVFVLDMGEPVRILDLAARFVRAHGMAPVLSGEAAGELVLAPEPDLPAMAISITGRRPGEKLYEELCYAAEQLRPSGFPGIHCWIGDGAKRIDIDAMVHALDHARRMTDKAHVLHAIRAHVAEMRTLDEADAALDPALSKAA